MNSRPAIRLAAAALVLLGGCGGEGSDPANPPQALDPGAVDSPGSPGDADGTAGMPDTSTMSVEPPFGAPEPITGDNLEDPGDRPPLNDDGPADPAPVGNSRDTTAIAGFWDLSSIGEAGEDRRYALISGNGDVEEYDDQDDAIGSGARCVLSVSTRIAANGDDRYDIADSSTLPGARSVDDVIIVVENGSIVFRFLGDAFDPAFGAGLAGIEERFPPVTGLLPTDLPPCEPS